MATYQVIDIVNDEPTFETPLAEILSKLKRKGAIKTLSPLEYHTDQQRKWYKGVCLTGLHDWNGDTKDEWDLRLKAECNGNELLKKETITLGPGTTCVRLTIIGVGKKNMTQFIENILSKALEMDWPVTPPDEDEMELVDPNIEWILRKE
jgi:hypothetical protein